LRSSQPYLEYLLDQASGGVDFGHDDSRRQFLGKMLGVAARIPDAAARDQFADRIAHKARITEEVVRAEIRKAAVNRRTAVTTREVPMVGQLKHAEKALIWGLIHNTVKALERLPISMRKISRGCPDGISWKWRGASRASRWSFYRRRFCSV